MSRGLLRCDGRSWNIDPCLGTARSTSWSGLNALLGGLSINGMLF